MAEKRFNVLFSGKLVEGRKPPEVLAKLCTVLDLEPQQVRELFKGGFGAVILKDLDGPKAYEMREELREVGAICTVQEITPPPTPEPLPGNVRAMDPPRPERPASKQSPDLRPRWQPPPIPEKSGPGIVSLIFKLILVAALAGGGWWGYQEWFAPPSPAYAAYIEFSEAMAREQYQKAADAAISQARGYAEMRGQMMAPTTMKIYGKNYSMDKPSISSVVGEISWIKRKRKAEKKNNDGSVTLQVEETVCRIPPGVSSALCKWPVTFLHDAEVSQADGALKVSSFKEERLTPQ
jgi:hypothetical protein